MLGGRYRLDERIASGGMGDVWRCVDDVLGRTVAVKILLPSLLEEPGFTERFRVEARTMATINHPGVVDIYDYGSDPKTGAYLVMEYVEGDALSRTLARVGRLTPARTMALVAQAADALHAAHEKGIVHRDVKPGNLLVRPNGTLVLTDFGIARSAGAAQLTAAGSVLGTATYISPEQAMGEQATALSDIYALGVVAYQCLAGRRPFEGENPLEIAMRHVRETPPPLPPDIPPQVRAIVERAMAKDPTARWPTASAFAAIARRCAADLASAGIRPGTAATQPVSGGPTPMPMSAGAPPATARVAAPIPPRPPVVAAPAPTAYRPAPGPYPPGYVTQPVQPKQASTGLILAIVVAVIVVAICVGAAIAVIQNQSKNSGSLGPAAPVVVAARYGDGGAGGGRGTVGGARSAVVWSRVVGPDEGRQG
jgi:serine/threonine-protein kinase